MADYQFDTPWANDSQNVQTFTEEEWKNGIVFKSLVESKTVNGVMKEVTRRFLKLEEVEDRQFVFDFVVDDDVSEQNFISGNTGNAKSILVKRNINANEITLNSAVLLLSIQTSNIIDANKITTNNTNILTITGGGRLFSDSKNWEITGRVQLTEITVGGANIKGGGVVVSNCYLYGGGGVIDSVNINNSRLGSLGGVTITNSRFSESILSIQAGENSTFVDCSISSVTQFTNCTLIRCKIPINTKLTNCTLIDCDYTVNTYAANLVTETTFRRCNISFLTTGEETVAVCNSSNKAYDSKIKFEISKAEHVTMLVYDSEVKYYLNASKNMPLLTGATFYGKSYMNVSGVNDADLIKVINSSLATISIMTDVPFFRDGSNFRKYNSTGTIYPGIINVVNDKNNRLATDTRKNQKYFVAFFGETSTNLIQYGRFIFIPWCKYAENSAQSKDSYNLEFIM